MKNNIPPFYVGQRVVALETSINKNGDTVKKGQQFIILRTRFACCQWVVDIGFITSVPNNYCSGCGYTYSSDGAIWCRAKILAPITTQFQSITLSKILEIETPLICVQ